MSESDFAQSQLELERLSSTTRFYSSKTLLVVVFATVAWNYYVFEQQGYCTGESPYHFGYNSVSRIIRFCAIVCVVAIWWLKQSDVQVSSSKQSVWVPWLQGAFPVLVVCAFSGHLMKGMVEGTCANSEMILAKAGLQAFPLLVFFVLRDTSMEALFVAWAIASFMLLLHCVQSGSSDQFGVFCSYLFTTILIPYNTMRQNEAINTLVKKLRATLLENEKLAVEAQALELRAMIGNVAHDLKTPLTSILSGIECMTEVISTWEPDFKHPTSITSNAEALARATESLTALRNCLKSMHGSNSFMTMTINRCIDYTKASKGVKLVPKMETAVVQSKLDMPVQLLRHTQSDVQIEILPYSPAICSHIITDRQWLIENLLCLLSNAVKYSHKGTVEVSVRLEGNAGEGKGTEEPQLRFEVQDTGVGLSEEAMQTLFNPFKQAQRLAGGTGLGLFSLAKRVEALHGQYGVSRRPDGAQGSLFWFTIPYHPDKQSADLVEAVVLKRADSAAQRGLSPFEPAPNCHDLHTLGALPPQSVLVVDDAPLIVKMTTLLLSRKGHLVDSAVNGADALEKLLQGYDKLHCKEESALGKQAAALAPLFGVHARRTPYDVVLMDLQMPVLDGIETIRRLRAVELKWQQAQEQEQEQGQGQEQGQVGGEGEGACHQLIIALSANSDEETRQSALQAGADAFMAKPFTHENFLEVMEHRMDIYAE